MQHKPVLGMQDPTQSQEVFIIRLIQKDGMPFNPAIKDMIERSGICDTQGSCRRRSLCSAGRDARTVTVGGRNVKLELVIKR